MNKLFVHNLCFQHENTNFRLKNINITLKSGEFSSIIGHSGSGKSTLFNLLCGIQKPNSGSIFINNEEVFGKNYNIPPEKRCVGMIFQKPTLFPHKTILENVIFAINNRSRVEKRKKATELLKYIGMQEYIDFFPNMISGGQQQLVTIVRTLANEPKILLLDEPFANLDVMLRRTILDKTLLMIKEYNITSLMVTHDPIEALEISDKLFIMENGSIIQSGKPYEIYSNPFNANVANFFGKLNLIEHRIVGDIIKTKFGNIINSDIKTHLLDKKKIYARPEAFYITNCNDIDSKIDKMIAKVEKINFCHQLLHLSVDDKIYFAKFQITSLPEKHSFVNIELDLTQILILNE